MEKSGEKTGLSGRYEIVCRDRTGRQKWREVIDNIVVTAGRNDLLDKYLAGASYTAAFYMGLVNGASTPTFAAGDTMASHAGWTESTAYSETVRQTLSWTAASGGAKSSLACNFTMNASATVAGAFIATNSTKNGTTGILLSAGAFTGGSRSYASGDTCSITFTLTTT